MSCTDWVVRRDDKVDKFAVEYPPRDESRAAQPELPKFIKLTINGKNTYLKTKMRSAGDGCVLFVSSTTLSDVQENPAATWESASRYKYNLYKVWSDKEQRIAFIGLFFAVLGIVIDASFDVGKNYPMIEYRHYLFMFMKYLSWALKIVGLILVFWKGFIGAK